MAALDYFSIFYWQCMKRQHHPHFCDPIELSIQQAFHGYTAPKCPISESSVCGGNGRWRVWRWFKISDTGDQKMGQALEGGQRWTHGGNFPLPVVSCSTLGKQWVHSLCDHFLSAKHTFMKGEICSPQESNAVELGFPLHTLPTSSFQEAGKSDYAETGRGN